MTQLIFALEDQHHTGKVLTQAVQLNMKEEDS